MDAIVSQILSNKKEQLDTLKKYLDQHLPTIKSHAAQIPNALAALEPSKHSMGMCYFLFVRAQFQIDTLFLQTVEAFLDGYNASQIRDRCPEKFAFVVHTYTDSLRACNQASRGISRLIKVINTFCPTSSSLSPVHADFVMLCLAAKNYKAARRVIDTTIFEISPRKLGVTPRDFMLYYYYSGMVWIGLKMFDKAHEFLQTAVTIPCSCLSAIMVEAFKKFVLVSLIHKGKLESLPRQCSPAANRHLKRHCPEYMEFAGAYTKRDFAKLQQVAQQSGELFLADRNIGLVQQCLAKYVEQAIQRLTSTYLTLSLGDIAANVGLPSAAEAGSILLRMIERGELSARINQKDGMVSFTDKVSSSLIESVEEEMEATQKIVQRLEEMDEEIQVSREYLTRQLLRDPNLREELETEARANKGKIQRVMDTFFKA
eukprot:TRINITY_DN66949_c0_g1_i1.p1 TRINITY_DN66949_c0_g1~~TRINITY_DN66949_c0_g1_i1.p1  ORF type:complete len:429 (+),score=77.44 TRINITY_DN66949_c0_g1_i1:37-1323(+)